MNWNLLYRWLGAAFTEWVRGFIEGVPASGVFGTAIGGVLAANNTLIAGTAAKAIAIAIGILLSASAHAATTFWAWAKANKFPNIFPPYEP